ncbi:hypothetical protein [Litchfieldia alkalitelluris]|uniref:hypothetical protein n=1 Tax=Litchfieldia alkalitelluris TaxID=304268 RepID=UPI002E259842
MLWYIHQNPLKAGLAKNVFDSNWTSIGEYVDRTRIVDIDFGLSLFSEDRCTAISLFIKYMQETNDDHCLDEKVIVKLSDSQVREYLQQLGIISNSQLQQMDRENRDTLLVSIKELNGVTIRQISRITGISKSVIQRLR